MKSSRPVIGAALGVGFFTVLLALGRIELAYAALLLGWLTFCLRSSLSLNWQIAIAVLLGIGFGLAIQQLVPEAARAAHIESFAVAGKLFIAALKMFVAPMILLSIAFGISQMAAARDLGRLGAHTVVLYLITMVLAAGTGLLLVNVFRPGEGSALRDTALFRDSIGGALPSQDSLPSLLLEMVYGLLANPVASLAEDRILPILVFAILLGIALLQIGPAVQGLVDLIGAGYRVIMHMIGWVVRLAPIGVLGLISKLVASVPLEVLIRNLGEFALVVVGGTLFHAFITLPLMARVLAGIGVVELVRGMREALLVAFSTSSSIATLPVSMRCAEENLAVPPRVASFVLPLGATVNSDGTALYEAIAAVFVAALYGIELSIGTQLVVFFVAIVTAIGAPGIPSAGMVTMIVVLESVGLPGEAVGLLITIDRFLDTIRTVANVEGDLVVAVCVARREGAT